jgi:mono/diheme cytochrome c family protein
MSRRGGLALALCLAATSAAVAADPAGGTSAGGQLYLKYCAQCHGDDGAGKGPAADRVQPAPRDFTAGKYKFRTTPSGMLPTDADLQRVIRQGLPHTTMPGWPALSDAEVQLLVDQLKTFAPAFGDPSKRGEPIEIPDPLPSSPESVARGRQIYEEQGCGACHGELGRGDGTSAPTLTDDWGQSLRPANLTQRWTFRGGPTRQDIFRTFSTGLNGTPMPSYGDSLAVEDRWHLVNYITSLGASDGPGYASLLVVAHVPDELGLERGAAMFETATPARFPLAGQIMEPGRSFHPPASSVEVRAVHNQRDIAWLVRWHDMRADTTGRNAPDIDVPPAEEQQAAPPPAGGEEAGDAEDFWGVEGGGEQAADQEDFWGTGAAEPAAEDFWGEPAGGAAPESFSDAVALQFPSVLPPGIVKPYFIFGDKQNSVDLWFVDLASARAASYVGRGSDDVAAASGDVIEVAAAYDRGEWSVIFKRPMRSTSGIGFAQDQFVPIAFSVWDGHSRERGNKRALSSWFYLYVEPAERVSAVGPMARAALGTLAAELLAIYWIHRRFGRRRVEPGDEHAGGPVPERGLARS